MPLGPYKYAAGLAIVALAAFGLVSWGKHLTQVEWDKDKAIRAALLQAEKTRNEQTMKQLEERHAKDIQNAASEAGRAAINRWLREHRVLPVSRPVSDCGSQTSADSSELPNGTGGEQGAIGSLEGFAANCALDAQRLTDWQELCRAQGCEISQPSSSRLPE